MQEQAGSGDDARQQAVAAAEQVETTLGSQRPVISLQIAELQARLRSLEDTARVARQASEAHQAAVLALQRDRALPAFVRDDVKLAVQRHNREFRAEFATARSRAAAIRGIVSLDTDSPEGRESVRHHIESRTDLPGDTSDRLREFYSWENIRSAGGVHLRLIGLRHEKWQAYCDELRSELSPLESRIGALETQEQAAEQELATLRGYDIPG